MPLQCCTMLCRCVSNPSHSLAQLIVSPLRFSAALRDYANTLRCQTLPTLLCSVLSSAMPELSCSLPKRNTAVHFPSEATQCLADADPFKADALPCQSLPTQVRSVLSRAIPLPFFATLCLCRAILFHATAAHLCSKPKHCPSLFPFPCFSVQCYAQAFRCYALPVRRHALPKLFLSSRCSALPVQNRS